MTINREGVREGVFSTKDFPGANPLSGRTLDFYTADTEVEMPIVTAGEQWHEGWDIPTQWAIDSAGQCWMDNAHGHPMSAVKDSQLINNAENHWGKNAIRRHLGLDLEISPDKKAYNKALADLASALDGKADEQALVLAVQSLTKREI